MPIYETEVHICGSCGYVLPEEFCNLTEVSEKAKERLCADCGKDVTLWRDRIQAVVSDADLGDFKRLINLRSRQKDG